MIPKYLKIKGLYSYQEEAEINFDKLEEAHIFGIFGRVGSGKSSILEAITFALYGEVSRMSRGDDRNYNLMNLKSNHLSIEFIFEVADDTYRILVHADRNKKVFEEVKRYHFQYFIQADDGKWSLLSTFDPKVIIGLEKSHFMKAVIIPQNRFQDFLMMADAERNSMMKTLFNLEKYDLMDKIKVLEHENNTELLLTNQNFDRVKDVSKEVIDSKNTEYLNLQTRVAEQQEILKKSQTIEGEMLQLQKQFEQLNILKFEVETFEKQTPQYETLSAQIDRYQYCRLNFYNLFEKQSSLTKKSIDSQNYLFENDKQLTENQLLLNNINEEFESIKVLFNKKETYQNELSDLGSILKIQTLKQDITVKKGNIASGNQHFNDKKSLIDNLKQTIKTLDTERQNLRIQLPDFTELNDLKDWFAASKSLKKDLQKLEAEHQDLGEKIETIDKSKRAIIHNDLPHFNVNIVIETPLSEVINAVKKNIDINLISKKDKQKQLQHDHALARIEDLAEALSEGKPCPLCGSSHHPSVLNSTNIKQSISDKEKEIEQIENTLKSLNNIINQLDTNIINHNKLIFDLQNKQNDVSQKIKSIKEHRSNFRWDKYSPDNEDLVTVAFKSATHIKEQSDIIDDKLIQENKKLDTETTLLEKYQKRLMDLTTELASLEGQVLNAEKQMKTLSLDEMLLNDDIFLKNRQQYLLSTLEKIENQYAEVDLKQRNLSEKVGLLRGGIIVAEKNVETLNTELKEVQVQIENQLKVATQFGNISEITETLQLNIDIETEQKRISIFKEKRYAADKNYTHLLKELEGKTYSKENHDKLIIENKQLIKDIEQHKENCTRLEEAIKILQAQLKEHNILKKELTILEARAANIKILKSLFTANGFVEYVSTMYLQNLCRAANERFQKLTQQQLRLEVTDKNDFQIRDMLNNGQVRSVRTLSGGQVFQAALSLAIALADSIQPLMRSKQNFFFLDEGFGSLDKESLQIVFETLKSLRKENRIVGVISHVEEMQQEIDRYLKVTFDSERGSQVEIV